MFTVDKTDTGLSLDAMRAFVFHQFEAFVNQKNLPIAYYSFSENFLDHDEPGDVSVGSEAAIQ